MIEFEHVSKVFDGIKAVDDLTLSVPDGAFCALIGSSGSGKSTSLRMINRLIPHSEGTLKVGGEDVTTIPVEALRRRLGYAIQSIGLFPHWTVARNIAAVPALLGWPQSKIDDRVRELLDLLQLDPRFAEKYPHQLSGGQQQRVGVARALAADPEVLLMDEPFGALDPITRDALQGELARIHRETGKTIVFVTHDMDEALRLASQIAILDHGRLVQLGSPREILTSPANDFVRDFIGRDDLGLKLLATETAADRVRPGEAAHGAPIPAETSLRTALSILVARHADSAPVAAADGRPLGTLHLDDLVRA
ncbi:ABC transporter ATP-binding protein [Inquilinus sp. NPDC058860]|uniref:ABC transporter ATP-binding protein n=1 Tax=Inquilinus sp. NPDC058860 TaxID=3346652 RepID=UPI0036820B27